MWMAWLSAAGVFVVGAGVTVAIFRLMGPDYDDKIH